MQFWCSASAGVAWSWTWRPYIGVWILLAIVAGIYFWRLRPLELAQTNEERQSRKRRVTFFAAALFCLWLALDWPLAALGAGYLASVHMVQYLLIALVVPPLLLLSIPNAAYDMLTSQPRVMALLRNTTQPLIAFFIFNVVISIVHWPSLVDIFMSSQLGAFTLDMTWLLAGTVFWWPVISPVPEQPKFTRVWKLAYLGLNGILIRPVFLLLLFSKFPAYATYELAPPIGNTSALSDQQFAAGLMKLGTAWIMVVAMGVIFHGWAKESAAADRR